jgi:hypothetical protein
VLTGTLVSLNKWFGQWEPLWLFLVLLIETIFSVLVWRMARMEYWYDKEWNERKAARRKRKFEFESLTDGESK